MGKRWRSPALPRPKNKSRLQRYYFDVIAEREWQLAKHLEGCKECRSYAALDTKCLCWEGHILNERVLRAKEDRRHNRRVAEE